MTNPSESGASQLAWRLLATLEGGSLLLATSALLVYTARNRVARRTRKYKRIVTKVLVTDIKTSLGTELKTQLETRGFTVDTVSDELLSAAKSGAGGKFDAIIVIGCEPRTDCLNGMAEFVSEDVYNNLKLLESLSTLVRPGGYIAWACAGARATNNAFTEAGAAFDAVIQASLKHISKSSHCEPIWIDRGDGVQRTAERVVAKLMPYASPTAASRYSIRNVAHNIGEYVGRWLKIVT